MILDSHNPQDLVSTSDNRGSPSCILRRSERTHQPNTRLKDYVCLTARCVDPSASLTIQSSSSVVVARAWALHQMDVHNAFLYGDLDEEVYMQLPPEFSISTPGKQSYADYSLFTYERKDVSLHVLIYVDDLIIASNNPTTLSKFKAYLSRCYHKKDLGLLKYFLGIEIARGPDGLLLTQRKYTLDILSKSPRDAHWEAALRVRHYLKGHSGQGILLQHDSALHLNTYCDSDWTSCPLTRRSLTGYFILLGNSLISWQTKKQPTVSRSSTEAQYRSMVAASCELTWLKSLLSSLGVSHSQPMRLFCDSQAALHIVANPVFHERTKHIEVDCNYVRDQIQASTIVTTHVRSQNQLADIFTKAFGRQHFTYLLRKLGIRYPRAPT
ncbi:UNVERIFIED_CONTAM: Retrovirus-related Pol polyprotein from transposon RE2 [Sesamum calycinum]|uniref:Retrovirus-related Pol polyprotein from transposon RE2 n=1 Tax=Sesamum calycinum TaxID=2727403 RepID=A0AAW2M0Z7_9LAMI